MEADALWKRAIEDPSFENQVDRLMAGYIPDFGISATVLLSRLEKNLALCVPKAAMNSGPILSIIVVASAKCAHFFALVENIMNSHVHIDRLFRVALLLNSHPVVNSALTLTSSFGGTQVDHH